MQAFAVVYLLYVLAKYSYGDAVDSNKEVDILWEKYGDVKADLERLKSEVKHLEEDGRKKQRTKSDKPNVKASTEQAYSRTESTIDRNHSEGRSTNTSVTFGYHLQYASVAVLKNKNVQFVIEVEVPNNSNSKCDFYQGMEKTMKKNVERQGNVVRGTLTASSDEYVVFSCLDTDKSVEVAYYFRSAEFQSTSYEMEKTYSSTKCKIDYPEHEITNNLEIIKSKASCDSIYLNESTPLSLQGWVVRGDNLGYIGSSYFFNSSYQYSGGDVYAEFAEEKEILKKQKYLLTLHLRIPHESESPLSATAFMYYHPKGFDGTTPPIKPGTLAMQDFVGYYQDSKARVKKGSRKQLYCTAAGNPSPELTWYKNGIQQEQNETNKTPVWNGLIAWKTIEVNNISARDVGNYTCRATSGNKTMEKTLELTLCVIPAVSFTYRQNSSMVEAIFAVQNNGNDSVEGIQCYNSSDTSFGNEISYSYDNTNIPLVDMRESQGAVFFKSIFWKKSPANVIPRRLFCRIYTGCSDELEEFQMEI